MAPVLVVHGLSELQDPLMLACLVAYWVPMEIYSLTAANIYKGNEITFMIVIVVVLILLTKIQQPQ